MKTVIFGGTFNPPHLGHERIVEIVEKEIKPDIFLVIPTYIPPHKKLSEGSPAPEQRLSLCRAAFSKYKGVTISDIELRRKGNSYTVDTLNELKDNGNFGKLYLVIGSDSLYKFTCWNRFREIFRLCTLVVIPRENDYEQLENKAEEYRTAYDVNIIVINTSSLVLSSSEVRNGNISEKTVSSEVLSFITENHLYNY